MMVSRFDPSETLVWRMIVRTCLWPAVVLAAVSGWGAEAPAQEKGFTEVFGIGGAGGMYTPTASPYDSKLMFISCDMGGSYRSTDGGKTWTLMHWRQVSNSLGCRPVFLEHAIFWVSGATPKVSRDKGVTWTSLVTDEIPWGTWRTRITRLAAVPKTLVVFVGTDKGVWRTADGGKTWKKTLDGTCGGVVVVGPKVYAAAGKQFHVSADHGETWQKIAVPLMGDRRMNSLTGAMDPTGATCLYATVFKAGVLQSLDEGKTWRVVHAFDDQNDILMPMNQTKVAYVSQSNHRGAHKVWRTRDGGKTWEMCFSMWGRDSTNNFERSWVQTDIHWGYYITHHGLGIDTGDPKTVMLATQGDFYISRDGGDTWAQAINEKVGVTPGDPGFRYRSIGLEVTANWQYHFDPHGSDYTYIRYGDMGLARSPDRGKTWVWSAKGCKWPNTFYGLTFDPDVKGRLYGAASNRHGMPAWVSLTKNTARHAGGVCISDNYGITWRTLGTGQPTLPCTSVCVDPKSPADKRTLYASFYEGGVYKSTDGGKTWAGKSKGLGNPGNMHPFILKLHPKTGDLYCGITAFRTGSTFPVPGGLWKSTDGAENWTDLTVDLGLHWANGFAVHPTNPDVIYLAAATIPRGPEGGIYKTADGGKSWKRLLKNEDFAKTGLPPYVHGMFVNIHPDNADIVYLGTATHGLWITTDAGNTWKRYEAVPLRSVTNVTFDPRDRKVMYVATRGAGVWKGPHLP